MIIPGYSNYDLTNGVVTNLRTNKILKISITSGSPGRVKLKSDEGVWKPLPISKVQAICTPPTIPEAFVPCIGVPELFIHTEGMLWASPTEKTPLGTMLKIYYPKDKTKYPSVHFRGKTLAIHQMLALTFLDSEYLNKGLCVLHKDDNKHNFNLDNLKVGTYSENNKAAYDTGTNPSKKQ